MTGDTVFRAAYYVGRRVYLSSGRLLFQLSQTRVKPERASRSVARRRHRPSSVGTPADCAMAKAACSRPHPSSADLAQSLSTRAPTMTSIMSTSPLALRQQFAFAAPQQELAMATACRLLAACITYPCMPPASLVTPLWPFRAVDVQQDHVLCTPRDPHCERDTL